MRKLYVIICGLVAMLMSSCYTHHVIGYLQDPEKHKDIPVYDSAAYEPYRIHVNDEVIYRLISMDETVLKMFGSNNNNTNTQYANSYRVHPDGTIDLPFTKPVKLVGLTELEAEAVVCQAFREIIPDADVKLALYNKYFSVIGDANSNRYFIYKEKMNIFQALAMTGDVLNSGDRRHIRIIRPRDFGQEPEILEFDIRTNTIINSKYYYVYPNDVIYVARTKNSFYTVPNYSGFIGLITSSVALLTTVLNYVAYLYK